MSYHYSTPRQCRTYSGQFQKCPKAEQCDYAPMSYEYCTPALHAECNFASYPHSTEHSDHEAYMQHIYGPPNHKPAGNFSLQITAKKYAFTIANDGNKMI
jgi:hypothetical protein